MFAGPHCSDIQLCLFLLLNTCTCSNHFRKGKQLNMTNKINLLTDVQVSIDEDLRDNLRENIQKKL